MVNFIWFTDEKNIYRRSPKQYAERQGVRGRWSLQERCDTGALAAHKAHCSHSVMASVGVSALSRTNLHFVDPGVKINGQYYRDTLLMRDLLPGIKQSSPDYFMFQQDGAPTHRARETVNLLIRETPDFTRWAIISGPPKFFFVYNCHCKQQNFIKFQQEAYQDMMLHTQHKFHTTESQF